MVNHPSFKIKANDKDITQKISLNLINLALMIRLRMKVMR